jgi:hypothetical protein
MSLPSLNAVEALPTCVKRALMRRRETNLFGKRQGEETSSRFASPYLRWSWLQPHIRKL